MKKFLLIIVLFSTFVLANELKNSTSPYLLQHKDNPVDWMEWGDRAFKKAKDENKFIFLSIGYSTCHWCHEMARNCFSKDDVAKVLNKNFVSIKVDKERLSYIDNYYQERYRIVNGKSGGWPLTVILLPNKKPIFFGTYMPKDALLDLLKKITSTKKEELEKIANSIEERINKYKSARAKSVKIENNLYKKAFAGFEKIYDVKYKGFGGGPKFPQVSSLNALLNIYLIDGNQKALKMLTDTLDAMAKGGIYDQIDGAFFRYSVDRKWQIPHFEKMLYTNAELISIYSKAYKITKSKLYEKVVRETIAQIDKRFFEQGLYYSASNADSKDIDGTEREGSYFVYDYNETLQFLLKKGIGKFRAKEILKYYGIEPLGNFEGGEYSNAHLSKFNTMYKREQHLLSEYRAKKEYPFIDKKINTAWNALYIKAKLDAGVIDARFEKEGIASLHKLLDMMYKKGELYHQTLLPNKPSQKGLLEDYAFVADALFSAYELTLDDEYLKNYNAIVAKSIELFYQDGEWLQSVDKEFKVKASLESGSYKSALAVNLENILRYVAMGGDYKALKAVDSAISENSAYLNSYPEYYPTALDAVTMRNGGLYFIKGVKQALKVGKLDDIKYPFVYKLVENHKEFMLCGLKSCFATVDSFNAAKSEVKKILMRR